MGFVFVLDRLTGSALPRRRARGAAIGRAGEATWPTQPFPLEAARARAPVPDARRAEPRHARSPNLCAALFDKLITRGCTAVGLRPTLNFPGFHGGGNGRAAPSTRVRPPLREHERGRRGGEMTPHPGARPCPTMRQGRFEEYAWFRDRKGWPVQQRRGDSERGDLNRGEVVWKVPLGIVESWRRAAYVTPGRRTRRATVVTPRPRLHRGHHRPTLPRVRREDRARAWRAKLEASATHAETYAGPEERQAVRSSSPPAAAAPARAQPPRLYDTLGRLRLPE